MKTVLYIEDTPNNVRMMRKTVNHIGHELLVATTGAEGLQLLDSHPDLVLVDIGLPDMSGFVVTERIREVNATLPVIAITAYASPEDRDRCLDAGCTDYLSKPFRADVMVALLEKYLA